MKTRLRMGLLFLLFGAKDLRAAQAVEAYRWDSVAMGGAGFVTGVIAHPSEKNLFYARTDVGGAYRWKEADHSWIPLTDWVSIDETGYMGIEALALDPQEPARVYMLAGTSYFNGGKTAILISEDYGTTFQVIDVTTQFKAHGNGMGRQNGERLAVDPGDGNVLFCGTRAHGLFRSGDRGRTWAKVESLPVAETANENGICFVRFAPAPAGCSKPWTTYLGVSRSGAPNLYQSLDGGKTWSPLPGADTELLPQRSALTSRGTLVVTYGNGAGPHGHWKAPEPMDKGALKEYDPCKETWKDITPAGLTRPFGGIDAQASKPGLLILSTMNTWQKQDWGHGDALLVSQDGGLSWRDTAGEGKGRMLDGGIPWIRGSSIHWAGSFTLDPFNPERAFVVSGNGVFMTEDLGSEKPSWTFVTRGMEETVPLDLVSIPGGPLASVVADYDGWVTKDVRVHGPVHQPRMGTSNGIAYAGARTQVLVRVAKKMYLSEDQGQIWTECAMPSGTASGDMPGGASGGKVALTADAGAILYTPSKSEKVFRSKDKGQSWSPAEGLRGLAVAPAADLVNPLKIYAYDSESGEFLASKDGGAKFSKVSTLAAKGSTLLRAVPGREGHLWVPLRDSGLVKSSDGGKTFTPLRGVETCEAVGFGASAPGAPYPAAYIWGQVGGVVGIHRSTDDGSSWVRVNDDAHEFGGPGNGHFVVGDMNLYGRVYMSSVGRGVIYGEIAEPGP